MNPSRALTKTRDEVFVAAIPGSKSYSNRALLIAAMRPGETTITNGLDCDDTVRLAKALDAFEGLEVRQTDNGFRVKRRQGKLGAPRAPVDMGGAGTPARFMLAFAAAAEGDTIVSGNARLCERPMGDILDTLQSIGIATECQKLPGCLPVRVTGGTPSSQQWNIRGDVSSQFTSSLLLYASQQSGDPIDIQVHGNVVSKPYVDMTLSMMRQSGLKGERLSDSHLRVTPATPSSDTIPVEVDASGMSYFLAAAAITGTTVTIPGIGKNSAQGDVGLARAFGDMGCGVKMTDDSITITGAPLKGIDIDMEVMPDVVLTLAVVAALADGPTHITNIANLRVKECDRINAAARELERLGVKVEEGADWLRILPHESKTPRRVNPGRVHTYDDHRVAMAFSLLGLVTDGIEIEDPECVRKSFPNFWDELGRFRSHHEG